MKGVIHHIEIYVGNLKICTEFWGWLLNELGYEQYQKWEKGISYKLNDSYIVFVQVDEKYSNIEYHRCSAGINHLAFYGETREFVDTITAKLKARGIRILYEDRHPYAGGTDHYAVYFEDPSRMKVEIVAE